VRTGNARRERGAIRGIGVARATPDERRRAARGARRAGRTVAPRCAARPRFVVARSASSVPQASRRLALPLRAARLHADAGKSRASIAHAADGGCHAGRFALS